MSSPTAAAPGRPRLLLFGLLTALLVIGVAEGMARVVRAVVSDEPIRHGYPEELYVSHPVRGFALRPGFSGFFSGELYEHVPIEINQDGYRDAPFPDPAADDHVRIAVLGDSVVFGSGVAAGDRFTEQLEERLGAGFRVLNLGVNSHTLGHYLDQVRGELERLDPDEVVLAFTVNDIATKAQSVPSHLRPARPADGEAKLLRHSALAWLVVELLQGGEWMVRRDRVALLEEGWLAWEERVAEGWRNAGGLQRLRRDLRSLSRELKRQDRRLLLAVMPDRFALQDPERFDRPRHILETIVRRFGIEAVDLHEAFEDREALEDYFLVADPIHLSPRGHGVVAETLAPLLLERAGSLAAPGSHP